MRKIFRYLLLLALVAVKLSGVYAYSPEMRPSFDGVNAQSLKRMGVAKAGGVARNTVAGGGYHTCAVVDGGIKCWGFNDRDVGEMGNPSVFYGSAVPVDVPGLTSGMKAITAGERHSCALTDNGSVKCWGHNGYGQLGDGTTTHRPSPVSILGFGAEVVAIAAGSTHTCALTNSGGMKCWGRNNYGQLGDGTTSDRLTPSDVPGLTSGAIAIAVSSYHTCAVVSGGAVKCWGRNVEGQLGDGTTSDRLTPTSVIGLSSDASTVAASYGNTCALTIGGGVKCWGVNSSGAVGDGTTTKRLTPVDVTGLAAGVSSISAGSGYVCALTNSGGAKCWGKNSYGALGDGTDEPSRLVPANVVGLNSSVVSVSVSFASHTCAAMSDGGIKCWGYNYWGQLGVATYDYARKLPTDVKFSVALNDISGNNKSDLLIQNADGALVAYLMNGVTVGSGVQLLGPGTGWSVTHTGHLNTDSRVDFILQHTNGAVYIYTMDGLNVVGGALLLGAGTGWSVSHIADFNDDGRSDLVLKHADGSHYVYLMDGTVVLGGGPILGPGTGWSVSHVAQLLSDENDRKADLVLTHTDGSIYAYSMDGATVIGGGLILESGTGWRITHATKGIGYWARSDVILQHTDGSVYVYRMRGATVLGGHFLIGAGTGWSPALLGDFNRDGYVDLVLQNTDGSSYILLLDGERRVATGGFVQGSSSPYRVTHLFDFNGDGRSDIVLRHAGDGTTVIHLMDATNVIAAAPLLGAGSGWSVVPQQLP